MGGQVGLDVAAVGHVEVIGDHGGVALESQYAPAGPQLVDGHLARTGLGSDAFDGERPHALLHQQPSGGGEHLGADLLGGAPATPAARRSMPGHEADPDTSDVYGASTSATVIACLIDTL